MLIAMYYTLFGLYTFLFSLLFGLELSEYNNPFFYVFLFISIILGWTLSIVSVLAFTSIYGEIRKNKPFDNMANHYFAHSLLRLGLHLARIKIILTGEENIPKEKFVFVSNHQENYDIIVLMPIFKKHPICFIAKESLFSAPIIGKWIKSLGNVPISRQADRSAAESMVKAIKRYKGGLPFGIFPEGKRSYSNEMIDFKPGAFKLALKPKADLLVGTIYDVCKILKKFPIKRQVVRVHIHPVIKYEEYGEMKTQEISAKVRGIMQKKLDEFSSM